jgi:hypothetical protein
MPVGKPDKKQEQGPAMTIDEAHAPFRYTTEGNFEFNGIFSDIEDPKVFFKKSAKLIITTLQGGLQAPTDPTPNLLGAADWADLSCALLAAIGRGYDLQYDKDRANKALKKDWAEAPDPNPLNPRHPTLFHRLAATVDSLNDQILVDAGADESSIAGWIIEAKARIERDETERVKASLQKEWRHWETERFASEAAAREEKIMDTVCKGSTDLLLKVAAELGLQLAPTPPSDAGANQWHAER